MKLEWYVKFHQSPLCNKSWKPWYEVSPIWDLYFKKFFV